MNTKANVPSFTTVSPRTAAIIAGTGLLLMAILSLIAYLNTFQSLVKFDDPALTAQNILHSIGAFRTAILLLFAVALLDVLVAWVLYILLMPANKNLSALAAWLRVILSFGKQRLRGEVILALRPKKPRKRSQAQQAQLDRFTEASAYAREAKANRAVWAYYEAEAKRLDLQPHIVAMTDYPNGKNLLSK